MALLWPGPNARPVRTVPIAINTVQHPLPSAGALLQAWPSGWPCDRVRSTTNQKVLILGTGGLSHQLDGARAGFINKEFDQMCMDKLTTDPEVLTRYSSLQIVEAAGSQGVELLNWIAMRGALTGSVAKVHANYHIPISNTASALLVLENLAAHATYRKAS